MLEQMTSDDLGLFHSLLSKRSDPVPMGRLEAADQRRTVDLMLQQYQAGGAREVTREILGKMNLKQLANQLSWSVCESSQFQELEGRSDWFDGCR